MTTPTPEEVAAMVKRLRKGTCNKRIADDMIMDAADMLERMSRAGCPLGEDCDLTVAWMAGASRARDEGWNAAIEAAAKVAFNACLVPPDGGNPTADEVAVCDEAAIRIRALRRPEGEKP